MGLKHTLNLVDQIFTTFDAKKFYALDCESSQLPLYVNNNMLNMIIQ